MSAGAAGVPEQQFVACGGEQKGAFALWNGSQAVLGPHIGDLTGAASCERWVRAIEIHGRALRHLDGFG